MRKPEFVQENETYKNLWGFEIQTDHLIPVRRSDLLITDREKKRELAVWWILPSWWTTE